MCPSPPFISYLVMYLHWCGHMDIYSIHWFLIQCHSSLFCCPNSSSFGHWELGQFGSCVPLKKRKLEYNCFIMLLVSAIQQSKSAIYIHISPPSRASLPLHPLITPLYVITELQAELSVLYSSFTLFHTW